jgi:hypothetical protein
MNRSEPLGRREALLALLGAAAGGCARGGDGAATPKAIKISYFRSLPEPKTKKLEATYRVVMSNSWRDLVGEGPREPFPKAAPGKYFAAFLTDREMERHVALLESFGLGRLIARKPEEFRPEELNRLSLDPREASFTRIFTVGSDREHRSYYYKDHHKPGSEALISVFTKIEAAVSRICESSILIRTMTEPLPEK